MTTYGEFIQSKETNIVQSNDPTLCMGWKETDKSTGLERRFAIMPSGHAFKTNWMEQNDDFDIRFRVWFASEEDYIPDAAEYIGHYPITRNMRSCGCE